MAYGQVQDLVALGFLNEIICLHFKSVTVYGIFHSVLRFNGSRRIIK